MKEQKSENTPEEIVPAETGTTEAAEPAGAETAEAESTGVENAKADPAGEAGAEQDPACMPEESPEPSEPEVRQGFRLAWRHLLLAVCLTLVTSVLLTYTFTAAAYRKQYTARLLQQQELINRLNSQENTQSQNLKTLIAVLEHYSYYADSMDGQAMLEAAFRAYVNASGDLYARYYTEEEYQALLIDNSGNYCGIGITVASSKLEKDGREWSTLLVREIYENSPASTEGLAAGDHIYAIRVDGTYYNIDSMTNGYDDALAAMRGEEGSVVEFKVFRAVENAEPESLDFSVTRRQFERRSVSGVFSETDPTVGIVRIAEFDLNTPHQLRQTVDSLRAQGAEHFVFDVRNNPGGDLQSIKAVLTYFLQEGDLILNVIDRDGTVVDSHRAGVMELTGVYEACNVSAEEIGIYAKLDMVVLCNENTASAAEVFTATLQDHGLAKVVGKKTFGKGIMQSTFQLPLKDMVGYIKLTTYAYVTQRGVSYHGVGIEPDVSVERQEALDYPLSPLPQSMDAQLHTAIAQLKSHTA